MEHADIAIVGAGIIGCMVAREVAARAPDASIVVLDRDMVGSGASRRSAGLHIPRGGSERVRRMTAYSHDFYERLMAADPSLPIRPVGLSVIASESTEPRLREVFLDRAALTRTDEVPGDLVRVPEDAGVWSGRGAQYADVRALALALAADLRRHADLRESVRVTAVEPGADHVVLGLGTGGSLAAGRVVLAPGPWVADPAWTDLVGPAGVRTKKIVAMHVRRPPAADDGTIIFNDEDAFLLPLPEWGYWLFSYTCREWDVDPDTVATGLSAANVEEAHACLARYAPGLVERCAGGRVFCDAYSPEWEPRVQALDGAGRVVLAGSANGSGYRLAPAIASEAADLLGISSGTS
jgi:D-arginine dehydrogenase